jgi:enamine deaminase RidA (YjgF/YER057c/UK114 family)
MCRRVPAVQRGDTIYLSGQLAHEGSELVAPAPVDEHGKVTDFSNMGEQMRKTYANAQELLGRFGASLDNVIEEVVYVLDIDAAFAVAGPVRKAAYGREDPQVASTLVGITRLAFPEQLIEIKFVAKIQASGWCRVPGAALSHVRSGTGCGLVTSAEESQRRPFCPLRIERIRRRAIRAVSGSEC